MSSNNKLLEELKDGELKLSGDDEDSYLLRILDQGKDKLNNLTGTSLDFDTEGQAKSLLFSYCRYKYNNAEEYFEHNFQREILRLQLQEASKVVDKND